MKMTAKILKTYQMNLVSILNCDDVYSDVNHMPSVSSVPDLPAPSRFRPTIEEDSLLFHTLRDSYVIIINDGKTAHRPNDDELDLVVPKWAGSIEIGVTQHTSHDITVPFKMSNAKTGTWIMSGEDVIQDAMIIIPKYIRNLNRLMEGDSVGVMLQDMGILHFFVNGIDQGPAAFNILEHVFEIIDLYGRVAQATIVDGYSPPNTYSPDSPISTESNATIYPSFSEYYGDNISMLKDVSTAWRLLPFPMAAIVFSSAHLAIGEMFEIKILECKCGFAGSFRMGVTDINILNAHVYSSLPRSVACLPHYTAYVDGRYIRYSRPGSHQQDLKVMVSSFEWLRPGDRIGLKKTDNNMVSIYNNSELLDVAFENVPDKVYVVMEIYGSMYKIQAVTRGNPVAVLLQTIPNDGMKPEPEKIDTSNLESDPNSATIGPMERRRRAALPYTFHDVHGRNIK